jgi:hypothetical protein
MFYIPSNNLFVLFSTIFLAFLPPSFFLGFFLLICRKILSFIPLGLYTLLKSTIKQGGVMKILKVLLKSFSFHQKINDKALKINNKSLSTTNFHMNHITSFSTSKYY